MLATTIIFNIFVININGNGQKGDIKICQSCESDAQCVDANGNAGGIEECVDFGGDIGSICYWKDAYKNEPVISDNTKDPDRYCITDIECSVRFDDNFDQFGVPGACLRCCPNEATAPERLCTETLTTEQEPCGVYPEHIHGIIGSQAPCCEGDVCLDNIAGICGAEVNEPCGKCVIWSYVTGESILTGDDIELEYISNNNCGNGMKCLVNHDDPTIQTDPYFVNQILKRRILIAYIGGDDGQNIVWGSGICIPSDGIDGSCKSDNDCYGCMRCCDGQCTRISTGQDCGFEGLGPCCANTDICQKNVCITPTAKPTVAPIKIKPKSKGGKHPKRV
eukprot:15470_1